MRKLSLRKRIYLGVALAFIFAPSVFASRAAWERAFEKVIEL